jgi:hypothetical protein
MDVSFPDAEVVIHINKNIPTNSVAIIFLFIIFYLPFAIFSSDSWYLKHNVGFITYWSLKVESILSSIVEVNIAFLMPLLLLSCRF